CTGVMLMLADPPSSPLTACNQDPITRTSHHWRVCVGPLPIPFAHPEPEPETDETHFPALEPRSCAPPRLSRPHGDQSRPPHPEGRSRHGPHGPVGLIAWSAVAQLPPDDDARPGAADAGLPPRLDRLRLRADFLKAASARRQGTAGFLLQARQRPEPDTAL